MFTPFRTISIGAMLATALLLLSAAIARGQAPDQTQWLDSLRATLKIATPSEVAVARGEAAASLARLSAELSQPALGVVLQKELRLDSLAAELSSELPSGAALTEFAAAMRRSLPGALQQPVNDLRAKLVRLAQMVSLDSQSLQEASDAITRVSWHFQDPGRRTSRDGDAELRHAFATLARLHPSEAYVAELRRRLSVPNYSSLAKREFLYDVSKRSFEIPIDFQECKDKTSIVGHGRFRIDLSLELPYSHGENFLCVHACGSGHIQAAADRSRVHVTASALPQIRGVQGLHIRPAEISGDAPSIDAELSTRLTSVQMGGILGRLRMVERIVAQAIQKRLSANDSQVAQQIEQTASKRVEEEGYALAHRINGLLRHGAWDRIYALDFDPEVVLANDAQGVRCDTLYARRSQLGGLTTPPPIAAEDFARLDLVTWVHQSAVNNVFDSFAGIRLDEATVRGLWQVEFKLTSDEWERLPAARIPAVITLAERSPVALRFVPGGVEIVLQATACEVDGVVQDTGPRALRVRYRVDHDAAGVRFVRQSLECGNTTPPDKIALWQKALGLFFGELIRPQAKFHNASFSPLFELGYLDVSEGWLTVGAARVSRGSSPPSVIALQSGADGKVLP